MWLPVTMGGKLLLRPARRMKPLPILSMVTVMPASLAQPRTRSLPCLSRSVSVRRQTPPLGVAPIFASSISEAQRRSPLMRMFSKSMAVAVVMVNSSFPVSKIRSVALSVCRCFVVAQRFCCFVVLSRAVRGRPGASYWPAGQKSAPGLPLTTRGQLYACTVQISNCQPPNSSSLLPAAGEAEPTAQRPLVPRFQPAIC